MIEWDDIRYFLNTVRAGSYTAAAERLNVNRTTIGRRLAHFEETLGMSLYEQTDEGYHPTSAGHLVLESGRAIERIADNLMERLASVRDAQCGVVRVAASAGIGTEFLPQLLNFRTLFPDIRVEMIYAVDVIRCIARRKADIAICLADHRPGHLVGPRICLLEQALYASSSRVAKNAMPAQDRVGWGHEMSLLPDRWVAANLQAGRNIVLEVNNWGDLYAAVTLGIGAAWLWQFVAEQSHNKLICLAPPERAYTTSLWLLHRADVPPDPAARTLLDFLAAEIGTRCLNAS